MEIKAILFDMDGVLVDSEHLMREAAKAALLEYGISTEDGDYDEFVGMGEDKFVGGPAEKRGHTYIPEMKRRAYQLYGELARRENIVLPGTKEALVAIQSRGYKMAVCSSADRVKVDINLSSIGVGPDFFDFVVTGSDVARKKPAPDLFLAASAALSVSPSHCVVIEDAVSGVTAANTAGMRGIAVTTSFGPEAFTGAAEAAAVVSGLPELPETLDRLSARAGA